MLAYAGSAGEQQVIEAQLGKRHAHVSFAQHDAHQVLGEDLGQQRLEQLTGGRRGLAELEHHSVTGRQCPNQRADGQVKRVVPRHDDADDAQWLVNDFG